MARQSTLRGNDSLRISPCSSWKTVSIPRNKPCRRVVMALEERTPKAEAGRSRSAFLLSSTVGTTFGRVVTPSPLSSSSSSPFAHQPVRGKTEVGLVSTPAKSLVDPRDRGTRPIGEEHDLLIAFADNCL